MCAADERLMKLAFQRGVLTLLKESGRGEMGLETAIEQIDALIEDLAAAAVR